MQETDDTFLSELCRDHISGQLRVAPEHVSNNVLRAMGKPPHAVYEKFCKRYEKVNKRTGKKQYVVPYFMSSHPGSTLKDAIELAEYILSLIHICEDICRQSVQGFPSPWQEVLHKVFPHLSSG